jgi:hypothetical protein
MNIHWLLPFENSSIDFSNQINLASMRLRAGIVANFFRSKGWEFSAGEHISANKEIIVIGKIAAKSDSKRSGYWLKQILEAKKYNCKIILDYTDNHLYSNSPMTSFYEQCIIHSDVVVCSSEFLSFEIKKKFKGLVKFIPDSIDAPIIKPKENLNNYKNILWFGHHSNILYLIDLIKIWPNTDELNTLFALTNSQGIEIFNASNLILPKNLSVKLGLWSIDSMLEISRVCNLCIIPSDLNDIAKKGASSNRLITALALGLPVCADQLISYSAFKDFFIDIKGPGFSLALNDPSKLRTMVEHAQKVVVPKFKAENLSIEWINLFKELY